MKPSSQAFLELCGLVLFVVILSVIVQYAMYYLSSEAIALLMYGGLGLVCLVFLYNTRVSQLTDRKLGETGDSPGQHTRK